MAEIRGAGIDEVVVSWWGRGSVEDARLPLVDRRRAPAVRAARRDPPRAVSGPFARDASRQDLAYLATLGVRDVYVYHPRDFARLGLGDA